MHIQSTYEHYQQWKSAPIQGAPYLSVVIPAYNEAERIVPTIGAVAAHVSTLGFAWELIIADDGSSDGTVPLLLGLDLANLHVLTAPENGGKGRAVQRGVMAAQGRYVLFADADNSTPIEEIDAMLATAEAGYDVVVGSRAAAGAREANRSFLRQAMSDTLRWIVQKPLHIGVHDTQCGFKLFRRDAALRLFGAQTLMGFSFDLEILYLAGKYGFRIAEQPVRWFDAPGSKVNSLKEARRFLRDIGRIKLNDWRGVYDRGSEASFSLPNLIA